MPGIIMDCLIVVVIAMIVWGLYDIWSFGRYLKQLCLWDQANSLDHFRREAPDQSGYCFITEV